MYWVRLPGGTIPFRGRGAPWRAPEFYPGARGSSSLPAWSDRVRVLLGEDALGEVEALVDLGQVGFDAAHLIVDGLELDRGLLAGDAPRLAVLHLGLPADALGPGLPHRRLHEDANPEDHENADDDHRHQRRDVVVEEPQPVERDLRKRRRRSLDHIHAFTGCRSVRFTWARAIRTCRPSAGRR